MAEETEFKKPYCMECYDIALDQCEQDFKDTGESLNAERWAAEECFHTDKWVTVKDWEREVREL